MYRWTHSSNLTTERLWIGGFRGQGAEDDVLNFEETWSDFVKTERLKEDCILIDTDANLQGSE